MTIRFPNASRFYDATRDAVHFWGYNQSMETSFFISTGALQRLVPGIARDEQALLAAFDSNSLRIYETAARVYGRGRLGVSYGLTPADF